MQRNTETGNRLFINSCSGQIRKGNGQNYKLKPIIADIIIVCNECLI